jgi:hypothetical protein
MTLNTRTLGAYARGLIGLGVVVVIFFFLVRSLASNCGDLKSEDIDIQPLLLVFSGVMLAGDAVLRAIIWWDLVGHFQGSDRPQPGRLVRVFLYSWVGRYVPGKVAYVLGRFVLGRAVGISSPALVGSFAYENVLLFLAGLGVVSLTLVPALAMESESVLAYLILPVLAVGGVVALQPAVLRRVLQLVLRVLGREPTEAEWLLPSRRMAKVLALYVAVFCLSGAGFYLMVASVTPYSPRYLPLAMGAFALAGIAGMISIFTPAGIGVREGVIVGILQFTMPVELAVLVSLVARVWATVVDVLLLSAAFAYDHVSGDRLLVATIRGTQSAGTGPEAASATET